MHAQILAMDSQLPQASTVLAEGPREQKMLKGYLPRVIYHRVYSIHEDQICVPELEARFWPCTVEMCVPNTLNPQNPTLDPQPSTLNPRPSTLNPRPSTLNPQPWTVLDFSNGPSSLEGGLRDLPFVRVRHESSTVKHSLALYPFSLSLALSRSHPLSLWLSHPLSLSPSLAPSLPLWLYETCQSVL